MIFDRRGSIESYGCGASPGIMSDYEELSVSLPDGYRAYARYYAADGRTRGCALYHHGIQSHAGWYEASARKLNAAGYAVLQADRRGSGRNEEDRGHAESAEQLIADAHAGRDVLLGKSGCREYHVIGVSWGGKLAAAAHVQDSAGVRSLTLVTPGLFPKVGVSRGEMARIGFAMLYEPRRLFQIPLDDAELFTRSARWKTFIDTDPLTLRECTAGFYLASRRMDRIAARLGQSKPVAVHLFLAGEEGIIDNEKTRAFIDALGWPDTRVTTYEQARHSLEFENDPEVYHGDLISFLDRHNA
jgi:acylglycerol lipase